MSRPHSLEMFETYLPDMVEEVRIMAESGHAPALVVSRRKMSRSLLDRLRAVDAAPDDREPIPD